MIEELVKSLGRKNPSQKNYFLPLSAAFLFKEKEYASAPRLFLPFLLFLLLRETNPVAQLPVVILSSF